MSLKQAVLALSVAVGVSGGLAAGTSAVARPGFDHMEGGQEGGLGMILHSVQLSSAQKQQIHQIMMAAHTQNAPQMAQARALQKQITTTLLASGTVTEAQLLPLEQQQESIHQQLAVSRLQTALAIRNVLTSAQLATAASMQAQLAALHQQEHAILMPAGN